MALTKLLYRVYEAEIPGVEKTVKVAMSILREISLREEIAKGYRQMTLLNLVAETEDRNIARSLGHEM